jgi:hypothetical protein
MYVCSRMRTHTDVLEAPAYYGARYYYMYEIVLFIIILLYI